MMMMDEARGAEVVEGACWRQPQDWAVGLPKRAPRGTSQGPWAPLGCWGTMEGPLVGWVQWVLGMQREEKSLEEAWREGAWRWDWGWAVATMEGTVP